MIHRVDFLHARMGQLRFKGASQIWAAFVARLEWGDKAIGQRRPRKPTHWRVTLAELVREISARLS